MTKYWIINTRTHEYIVTKNESFDGEWKENYPHTKNETWLDVYAFRPWIYETKNGIFYSMSLCMDGGYFTFYVDITKHTQEDIDKAIEQMRRDQDVVSLRVFKIKPYREV